MIISDDAAFSIALTKALAIFAALIILLGYLTWYGAKHTFMNRK